MSESLRIMGNRMVLLNPLVSLLKKTQPMKSEHTKSVHYVNQSADDTQDQEITASAMKAIA